MRKKNYLRLLVVSGLGAALVNIAPAHAAGNVAVTPSSNLNPAGQIVKVSGTGFDGSQGIYVQYCAKPSGAPGTPAGRATRCRPEQTAPNTYWVHSPTFGSPDEAPMNADGSFSVNMLAAPSITTSGNELIDCTTSVCGFFTRRDHNGGGSDYSKDTFTAVSFGTGEEPPPPPPPAELCPGGLLRPIVKSLYALLGVPIGPGVCSIP